MRVRRSFVILATFGVLLLAADAVQRWWYVHRPPSLAPHYATGQGPLTQAIFVAGQGMDEQETATCQRDLARAVEALKQNSTEALDIEVYTPAQERYSNQAVLQRLAESDCSNLVVYLTGHGGGVNFGAGGGLNLRRESIARAIASAKFETATVLVDCCWSGEFAEAFQTEQFPGKLTLYTSTDSKHPAPFPVSFLSPRSFGYTFFENWDKGPEQAFLSTNQGRQQLKRLYDERFGLTGTRWTSSP